MGALRIGRQGEFPGFFGAQHAPGPVKQQAITDQLWRAPNPQGSQALEGLRRLLAKPPDEVIEGRIREELGLEAEDRSLHFTRNPG